MAVYKEAVSEIRFPKIGTYERAAIKEGTLAVDKAEESEPKVAPLKNGSGYIGSFKDGGV